MSALAGEIVWVDLNPTVGREQSGRRPVLVVGDTIGQLLHVVPLTHTDRDWPIHYRLEALPGDTSPSIVMCEQIRAVSSERVLDRAGRVRREELRAVRRIIGLLLEIEM